MNRQKGSRDLRKSDNLRKSRTRKRKNVFNPQTVEHNEDSFSASAKKLKRQKKIIVLQDNNIEYRIINFITVYTLLERCLGGFNQNNNESYNQLFWKISPKIIPSGSITVELAAYIAACVFNEGSITLLQMLQSMGVNSGPNTHQYVTIQDANRTELANCRAEQNTREERIRRRQQQTDILETTTSAEVTFYGPGIDDSV